MANWYQRIILPRLIDSAMGSKELEKIRCEVIKDASGVILEIGAGPGYNFSLYKNVSKLYALEPSKELVQIAKTRAGSLAFPIEFLNTGAENIPLPDHSIDTAVSTWTLCSVTSPIEVLQEIKRVLKPGGKFVFVDHGASPNPGLRVIQTLSTSVTKYFSGNCHYDRQLEELIKEAGFIIEKIKHPRERFKPLIYNYQGIATQRTNKQV